MNRFQESVLEECLEKGSGGLSLPMGYGKTLIGLNLVQRQTTDGCSLIIVSKTLLESWITEINKFYDEFDYVIFHKSYQKEFEDFIPTPGQIVITTPEVLSAAYKEFGIDGLFVEIKQVAFQAINVYNFPVVPFSRKRKNAGFLYSLRFDCMIVDEVQTYTNITSIRCKAISSICATHRWAMSGTIFNEPKPERVLGFYLIIGDPNFPRNLPDASRLIKSTKFKGVTQSLVVRLKNEAFVPPPVREIIIEHNMNEMEQRIYLSLKNILNVINKRGQIAKAEGNVEKIKLYGALLLVMITYLRQSVVCH